MRYLVWIVVGLYVFVYGPIVWAQSLHVAATIGILLFWFVSHICFISGIGITGLSHLVHQQRVWGSVVVSSLAMGVVGGLLVSVLAGLLVKINSEVWMGYILGPLVCLIGIGWGAWFHRRVRDLERYRAMLKLTLLPLVGGAMMMLFSIAVRNMLPEAAHLNRSFISLAVTAGFWILLWVLLPGLILIFSHADWKAERVQPHAGP